ncbi:hypothetical protein DPMN_086602 [Dreissena polymorpha]|uniref:Uncharacterized protein n=1 Tax=Dreissena polymorpha TaxID=45954 RepID=A0A9D4KRH7_DREPO|nr:hypothetical protein DPMN_086602 [Dreissena polymorpha]
MHNAHIAIYPCLKFHEKYEDFLKLPQDPEKCDRQTHRAQTSETEEVKIIVIEKQEAKDKQMSDKNNKCDNRVLTRKNAPPPGGHTNLLTKFHEYRTINVASRVLIRQMLTLHNRKK